MTVTPASDPCVGNLATPVNSGYFMKWLINNLPFYRQGISPTFRGLETGAAFGYHHGLHDLWSPQTLSIPRPQASLLPSRSSSADLFLLYNQPGKQPHPSR